MKTTEDNPQARPEVKIAIIGGGSRYWARDMMKDLALQAPFDGLISLYDLDHEASEKNVAIGGRIFERSDSVSSFRLEAHREIGPCLKAADFVVISIEPGPMECRYADLEIPLKYGIIQPVGDTTGPGGILRALRSIPTFQGFAREIMEHCPDAWVINYTNPMTLCTRALYDADPEIKAFGCCHEVFGSQMTLLNVAHQAFDQHHIERSEVEVDVNGINHFTWITEARCRGKDVLAELKKQAADPATYYDATEAAEEMIREKKYFGGKKLVTMDLTRRFGAMAAAGNRHLVEFVPWYARDLETLHKWGVICTPYQFRIDNRKKEDESVDSYGRKEMNATGEEGVRQMTAILGLGDLKTNVNLPNQGQAAQFELDAVVETNAFFSKDSVRPLVANDLPSGAARLVERVVGVQELTLEASNGNDREMAFQALLNDPLVTLDTNAAWKMFGEMLEGVKEELPTGF